MTYDVFGLTQTTHYLFDDAENQYKKTQFENGYKEYHYDDPLRRLTSIVVYTGKREITQSFTYVNNEGAQSVVHGSTSTRIKSVTIQFKDAQNVPYNFNYHYTYDKLGNIKTIEVKDKGILKEQVHYTYDDFNQLIREDVHVQTNAKDRVSHLIWVKLNE